MAENSNKKQELTEVSVPELLPFEELEETLEQEHDEDENRSMSMGNVPKFNPFAKKEPTPAELEAAKKLQKKLDEKAQFRDDIANAQHSWRNQRREAKQLTRMMSKDPNFLSLMVAKLRKQKIDIRTLTPKQLLVVARQVRYELNEMAAQRYPQNNGSYDPANPNNPLNDPSNPNNLMLSPFATMNNPEVNSEEAALLDSIVSNENSELRGEQHEAIENKENQEQNEESQNNSSPTPKPGLTKTAEHDTEEVETLKEAMDFLDKHPHESNVDKLTEKFVDFVENKGKDKGVEHLMEKGAEEGIKATFGL